MKFRRLPQLFLACALACLAAPLYGDMFGKLPEGLPISWLETQNPHYSIFEEDFLRPPRYPVTTTAPKARVEQSDESFLENYSKKQELWEEVDTFLETYQKHQRTLLFANTYNPVEIAPVDFMVEHAGVTSIMAKGSDWTKAYSMDVRNMTPLEKKERMREIGLGLISAPTILPATRPEHEILIAQVFFNIRASEEGNFIMGWGGRNQLTKLTTTIPFAASEGRAYLRELGDIGRRASLAHFEMYRAQSKKWLFIPQDNLKSMSGIDFGSQEAAVKWDKKNNDQRVAAGRKKRDNFESILRDRVLHDLSHDRYYNYTPEFAWMLREFPRTFRPLVLRACESDHPLVRRNAAGLVGDLRPVVSDRRFGELLATKDPIVRARLMTSFIKSDDKRLPRWIEDNFAKADGVDRARMVHAMSAFGNTALQDEVVKMLSDKSQHWTALDSIVRARSGESDRLEAMAKGDFPSNVFKNSKAKDWDRYYALMGLTRRGDPKAAEKLYNLFRITMPYFPTDRIGFNKRLPEQLTWKRYSGLGGNYQDSRAFYGSRQPLRIMLDSGLENIRDMILIDELLMDEDILDSTLMSMIIEDLSPTDLGIDWGQVLEQWILNDLTVDVKPGKKKIRQNGNITKENQEQHGTFINRGAKYKRQTEIDKFLAGLEDVKDWKNWAREFGPKYTSRTIRAALLRKLFRIDRAKATELALKTVECRLQEEAFYPGQIADYDTAVSLLCFQKSAPEILKRILDHRISPVVIRKRALGSLAQNHPAEAVAWTKKALSSIDETVTPIPLLGRAVHLMAFTDAKRAYDQLLKCAQINHPDIALVAQITLQEKYGLDLFFDPVHDRRGSRAFAKRYKKLLKIDPTPGDGSEPDADSVLR